MNEIEVEELIKKASIRMKEITSSKEDSLSFLQDIGILDNKGKVKETYKRVCIPIDQA